MILRGRKYFANWKVLSKHYWAWRMTEARTWLTFSYWPPRLFPEWNNHND